MKVTKQYLKKIIKEEIMRVIGEGYDDEEMNYRASQPSGPPMPAPTDPLEGYSIPVDYENPHNTQIEARQIWKQFISKDINPKTKQRFNNPAAAKKEFIKRYLGSI